MERGERGMRERVEVNVSEWFHDGCSEHTFPHTHITDTYITHLHPKYLFALDLHP